MKSKKMFCIMLSFLVCILVTVECHAQDAVSDKDALRKEVKEKYNLIYMGDARDDVTGNWRVSLYSGEDQFQDFALEYYNAFFESDKEIHAVVNFAVKVTYKITYALGELNVTAYDYVDGEEHSAKKLFSGTPLQQFTISIETGEIQTVKNEETTAYPSGSNDAIDSFIKYTSSTIENTFGNRYSFSRDDEQNVVILNLWSDGLANQFMLASNGDSASIESCSSIKDSAQSICKSYYEALQLYSKGTHFELVVLNDINKDNILLGIMDGVCFYDALN